MSREMTNEEAIANLNHIYGIVSPDIQRSLDVAIKALEERPQGEWQPISDCNRHECNRCKEYAPSFRDGSEHLTNFCPNCGAAIQKPNCVTCDHFGDCEGCEKGDEE